MEQERGDVAHLSGEMWPVSGGTCPAGGGRWNCSIEGMGKIRGSVKEGR